MLGIFPAFGDGQIGGIEASAAAAWEAISRDGNAQLFTYVNGSTNWNLNYYSQLRGILRARQIDGRASELLVWHLGLLKLLPFIPHQPDRIVVYLHGIEAWKPQDRLTRKLLNRVSLFLCNSEHTWTQFLLHNPSLTGAPHSLVPLGLDEVMEIETQPPETRAIGLIVSRLSKGEDYKGHREVIDAWPLVLQRQPDAELWIAGDGDLLPELQEMVKARGLVDQREVLRGE